MSSARSESERLWSMPFLGQLTDDCRDFHDDIRSGSVTPFTYYATQMKSSGPKPSHLLNPLYLFLRICSDLYISSHRDPSTGSFLGRRIARTLRSIQATQTEAAFGEFLEVFCSDHPMLYSYCWSKLRKQFPSVTDPEKNFFRTIDALGVKFATTNRRLETYVFEHITQIEDALLITPMNPHQPMVIEEEILIAAMNYSVKAGGKRLRILLLLMVADLYQIDLAGILPIARGIEYLHTSSLIFDDLPAQDNSDLRRGRSTLHKTIINGDVPDDLREGRAQLAAVDLIAVSMSVIYHGLVEQGFSPSSINQVIGEISALMHSLCVGQMMDLRAAHVGIEQCQVQIEELDRIAWLKTGKTIEAVLVIPAILAHQSAEGSNDKIPILRELSRLMGILFQMRDDLLDIEGSDTIGKPTALDVKNNTVTYVSILGIDGTRQRLQEYQTLTLQLVDQCWATDAETIKDVVRHIVSRKA